MKLGLEEAQKNSNLNVSEYGANEKISGISSIKNGMKSLVYYFVLFVLYCILIPFLAIFTVAILEIINGETIQFPDWLQTKSYIRELFHKLCSYF